MPCYPYNHGNYGQGDYYRGDYYRGDPFVHKKILGGALKLGTALVKATPIGRVVSTGVKIGQAIVQSRRNGAAMMAPPLPPPPWALPGGTVGPPLPPGYSPAGFPLTRRKRMNPLNVRALDRAIRRLKGFEKRARKVGSFVAPGRPYRLKIRKRKKK